VQTSEEAMLVDSRVDHDPGAQEDGEDAGADQTECPAPGRLENQPTSAFVRGNALELLVAILASFSCAASWRTSLRTSRYKANIHTW